MPPRKEFSIGFNVAKNKQHARQAQVVRYLLQQRTERVHTSNPLAIRLSTWPADHSTADDISHFLLQWKLEDPSPWDKKAGVRLAGHWHLRLSKTKEFTLSPEQKKIQGEKLSPNYEDFWSLRKIVSQAQSHSYVPKNALPNQQ